MPDDVEDWELSPYVGSDPDVVLLPQLIAGAFGLSTSEARRLLKQGGVKLDGETVPAESLELHREALDGKILQVREAPLQATSARPSRQTSDASAILPRPSGAASGGSQRRERRNPSQRRSGL